MRMNRHSFYRSLLWVLLVWAPGGVSAQSIRGTVTDPDGIPMAGVKVELAGASFQGWTNLVGKYEIRDLPVGTRTVRALSDDFETIAALAQVTGAGSVQLDLQFLEVRKSVTSIEVIGESVETLHEIPGSVFMISTDELRDSRPIDANEVLRRVPGVNLREDSGPMAMRLNVGIRGLNPDRSRKVLMLEDGIPIALAPYGEPEMYYSPPIDRMRRVEVLKGSGQILYGPQTIGGVVNFVTPDPPPRTRWQFDIERGQRGFFSGQGSAGGSNQDQSAGWLLNFLHKQGDGFRDFYFDIDDVQAKLTLKPNLTHTFGVKLGIYDEGSNSTYLGLTLPQFIAGPNQNAVPHDLLKVRRFSGSLSHTAVLNPNAVWNTTFFAYNTVRNWRRQDWDRSDGGREYLGIDGDPSIPGGAIFLRDSTGNRNRAFNVAGLQSGVAVEHQLGNIRNKLDAGIRYVYEEAGDQRINGDRFDSLSGILRDDEDRFGKAFSAYVQNRFFLSDRVIFTPGIRMEHYRYQRHILRQRVRTPEGRIPMNVDIRNDDVITKAIPGLGLSLKASDAVTFFTGVHRGFAPPRTKDAITSSGESLDLDAELSWNYEAGVRFAAARLVKGEFTFFGLDFENQIIPAAESGGATTTLINGGETLHRGFESTFRVNWNELFDSPFAIYTDVRHMYLATAKFTKNTLYQGNRLPYAPENTFSLLFGVRRRQGFGFQMDASYIGDQFGDNNETVTPSADGTIGLLPSYTIWNLSFDYKVQRERYQFTPYILVKNLTDQVYISSRAPQGIQPGMFRQVNMGISFTF